MVQLLRAPFVALRFLLVLPYMLHTVATGVGGNIFLPGD
jgi:hypothetical protein